MINSCLSGELIHQIFKIEKQGLVLPQKLSLEHGRWDGA